MRENVRKLLSLAMAMSIVWGIAGMYAAAADEGEADGTVYEDTYTYVLNFSDQDIEGYEDYDARRLYASDHYAGLYVDEDGDGINESNWNWTCFSVLNMINTGKLSEGGEGAYASIPVYCVDAVTDGVAGYAYRRINLEESDYFDDNTACRLRAIMMNSFPYVTSMSSVESTVNAWITESGGSYEQVVNLTESEVISATQAAIWTLTNNAEVYAPYLGTGGYYTESEMVDTAIFNQEKSDYTNGNITAMYNYLMALEPMAVQSSLVANASFMDTRASAVSQSDGTVTVTVTTTVTAEVYGDTQLMLTAVFDGKVAAMESIENGTNKYTLTLTDLTGADSILLAIDGVQEAADVFLFDPVNGYKASQSMAGYDTSTLPVHADITVIPEVILSETTPEIESEAETESEPTTEKETEPETMPETDSESETESEPETKPETDSETETEATPETESETEFETTPETESETKSETMSGTEPETELEATQESIGENVTKEWSEDDTENSSEAPKSGNIATDNDSAPETGDIAGSQIVCWLIAALVSCTALSIGLLAKKQRRN